MRREARQRLIPLALAFAVTAALLSAGPRPAAAQPSGQGMMGGGAGGGMPDLRVMNGKPLPDRGMAAGTVTVRVARKMPVNAVAGVEVTALIKNEGGDLKKRTAKTDSSGRAVFEAVGAGQEFQAEVVVDGEKLKTTAFPVPSEGGVRTMLIAGLGAAPPDGAGAGAGAGEGEAAGGGDGDSFGIGVSSGTVDPAPSLPDKTLEIRALDEKGKPLAGHKVLLGMVSQSESGGIKVLHGKTGTDGTAKFDGLTTGAGVGYAAVIDFRGMRLGTRPFTMPDSGGVRAEIRALERTADPAVIAIGGGGRIILEMHEDALQVIEMLPLENRSNKIFDPGAGAIEIPLPKGFVNAAGIDSDRKIEVRQNYGVAVRGAVTPLSALGQTAAQNAKAAGNEVTFDFVLPYYGSSREFTQLMPNGLGATTLITAQAADLTIEGTGIGPRESRELGGRKYWVMGLAAVAPGGLLSFTVKGLPSTDNSGRVVSAVLTLLLIAAAIVFGRRPASARKAAASDRQKLLERREALFADLVRAERDRRTEAAGGGGVGGKDRRGQLVAKLEAVYRELAAMDEQRAA